LARVATDLGESADVSSQIALVVANGTRRTGEQPAATADHQ